MGQCLSTEAVGGETEEAYRARWQAAGLGQGAGGHEARNYDAQAGAAVQVYTTTADVGLPRSNNQYAFQQDTRLHQLEAIDENNSLKGPPPSPPRPTPRTGTAASPVRIMSAPESSPQSHSYNWTRGELIGQGAFGSVYLGMDNDTGHLMAVKQVSLSQVGPANSARVAEHVRSLEAEVKLLQSLNHPNIVRYLGTERTPDALNILLEYVPGGSIASLLAKFGSFKESVVRVYTKQILMGLEYLHTNGIIHRDIKGANILVDNTGLVKLADFGASKKIESLVTLETGGSRSVKGTPYWMAPEVITQSGHGRQADIWSVACTVIEMATGKPPWSQYGSQVSAMFQIAKSKGPPTIPEHLSPDCKDFLYLCFNRNWRERPSAAKLLDHPFLVGVKCRTVAAPLNNIAAVLVPGVEPDSQQIPAYRSPRGKAGGVPDVAQAAPLAPQPGASPAAPRRSGSGPIREPRSTMSPLRNHLSASRQGVEATSRAARHLDLDGLPDGGQSMRRQSAGPRQSPRGPAGAGVRDSGPHPALKQHLRGDDEGRLAAGGRSSREALPEATVALAESGTLRGSGSGSLRRSGSLRDPAAVDAPATSVPSTIALSAGAAPPLPPPLELTASFRSAGSEQDATVLLRSQDCGTASLAAAPTGTVASAGTAASSGSAVTSAVSGASGQSEFNPMEEPAWMTGACGAPSPSEEATSVHPVGPRPTSGASVGTGERPEGIAPAPGPSTRSTSGAASMQQSTRSGRTASEGPIVYTIDADVGSAGVQALPWDVVPGSVDANRWSIRSGGSIPGKDGRLSTGAGAEEDAILAVIQQRAQHDLRASMAAFSSRMRRSGGSESESGPSLRSSSGSDASARSAGSSEATSPSKQRVIPPTRIPRVGASPAKGSLTTPRGRPAIARIPSGSLHGSLPLPPPAAAPTPTRPPPRTPARLASPSKRPSGGGVSLTATGGSYEQLLAQRQARHSTGQYASGSRSAHTSPSKSMSGTALATPRREGRPSSAAAALSSRTPARTPRAKRAL